MKDAHQPVQAGSQRGGGAAVFRPLSTQISALLLFSGQAVASCFVKKTKSIKLPKVALPPEDTD